MTETKEVDESEALLQAVLLELRAAPAERGNKGTLLLLSLVAFVALGAGFGSMTSLLLLVPVVFFHELGHVAAMRLFGYRDLSVLFIPLVGAVTTGRKERASAWEQGIVSLMGPAPGIVLALTVALALGSDGLSHPLAQQAIGMTLILNGLNLLPFEPFDGGRLASIVLLANRPRLRVVVGTLSSVALALLALRFGSWLLAVIAGLSVLTVSYRYRLAAFAERLRKRLGAEVASAPARIVDAPEPLIRSMFAQWQAEGLRAGRSHTDPRSIASALRGAYASATLPRAAWSARLGLAVLYVLLLAPVVALVAIGRHMAAQD